MNFPSWWLAAAREADRRKRTKDGSSYVFQKHMKWIDFYNMVNAVNAFAFPPTPIDYCL